MSTPLTFLQSIGHVTGDRVYVRAIAPKKTPMDDLQRRGMAWVPPGAKRPVPIAPSGFLELRRNGAAFTRTYSDGKNKTYPEGLEHLQRLNSSGYGIYAVINPGGGDDESITEARALFYECDDIGKAAQWEQLRAIESATGAAWTAVETYKSLHCYGHLDTPLTDLGEWRRLQQRLIQRQNSDPAIHNPARLMRLPGFDHWRWDGEALQSSPVTLRQTGAPGHLSAIEAVLPEWDTERWEKKNSGVTRTKKGISAPALPTAVDSWDIRNFAHYLDGFANGRRGWDTCKCPVHNGESDNSLHINTATGAFTCHAGCDSKSVYDAALDLACSRGYERPQGQDGSNPPATDTKQARRERTKARARRILQQARPLPHVSTEGGYMPTVPPLPAGAGGAALSADMGSGKTERIAHDLIGNGLFTLVLQHRNGLGKQTAQRCKIPHVHDYRETPDGEEILGLDARASGGMTGCINSIQRMRSHIPSAYQVVIDEAMKTLTELLEGGTIRDRYSAVLEAFFEVLRGAEAVYVAEANIDAATIKLVEAIIGKPLHILQHKRQDTPWAVSITPDTTAWRTNLQAALLAGQRVLITSTSLNELRYWEYFCRDNGIDCDQPLCSETNDSGVWDTFYSSPRAYLQQRQPQCFLFNQSAESGVSIDDRFFDVVYGYAQGFPPSVIFQQLGRYRQPVPRIICCPQYIPPSRWEKPQKTSALAEMGVEVERWAGRGFAPSTDTDQNLIDHYLAARRQQAWAEKVIALGALTEMLQQAGHHVKVEEWKGTPETAALFKTYKERLARDRAQFHAALEVEADHDAKWAGQTLSSASATHEDRCRARKVLTTARFPGIDWNDAEVWYHAVFCPSSDCTKGTPSRGPLAPGAALWAECDRVVDILQQDTEKAAVLLAARLRGAHLLPIHHQQVECLAPFKPLAAQLLECGTIAPDDPRVAALATMARTHADILQRYLRITAREDQSDMAIACKVLRKFGLVLARCSYPRQHNGNRAWSYTVSAPPLWAALVEARTRALEAVTDLLDFPINKTVTTLPLGALVKCLTTGAVALVEAVEGAIATLGDELGRCWQAPVDTLTPA